MTDYPSRYSLTLVDLGRCLDIRYNYTISNTDNAKLYLRDGWHCIVTHKPPTGNAFGEGIMHLRREANQISIISLLHTSTVHVR
jgi:hypothetical protein